MLNILRKFAIFLLKYLQICKIFRKFAPSKLTIHRKCTKNLRYKQIIYIPKKLRHD